MKKRIIASVLSVLLWVAAFGQLPSDSALFGSWQLVGHEAKGIFSSTTGIQILSFFDDGVYQHFQHFPSSTGGESASYNSSGDWVLEQKKGNPILTRTRRIPASFQSLNKPMESGVEILTDSLLVLSGYEGKQLWLSHYRRIEDVPRIAEHHQIPAQETSASQRSPYALYLVHCAGTRKPVRIKPEGTLNLAVNTPPVDTTLFTSLKVQMEGSLLNVHDSMITMKLYAENTFIRFSNNSRVSVSNSFYYSDDEEHREILMSDIQSLKYSGPTRYSLNIAGGIITTSSALTLLMVAPLVSIQYKEGGFNADRYFLWAGASLAGLAIGIPLTIFSGTKTYRLSNYHSNTPCPNCWSLEKMPLPQ
jgi:hypothetical protein